jgi:hypothetical protein
MSCRRGNCRGKSFSGSPTTPTQLAITLENGMSVGVVNLQGRTFHDELLDCPFRTGRAAIEELREKIFHQGHNPFLCESFHQVDSQNAREDVVAGDPSNRDRDAETRLLPPRRILEGVVHGVNVGGNQSGIPTPQGFVYFDRRYKGKPLVFVGTVGLIPKVVNGRPGVMKRPERSIAFAPPTFSLGLSRALTLPFSINRSFGSSIFWPGSTSLAPLSTRFICSSAEKI